MPERVARPFLFNSIGLGLLVLVLQPFAGQTFAQKSKTDSLESRLSLQTADTARIRILHQLAANSMGKNPGKSLDYLQRAKALFPKNQSLKIQLENMRQSARAHKLSHHDSLAFPLAERALNLAKANGNLVETSACLDLLYKMYKAENIGKALEISRQRLEVDQKIGNPEFIASDHNNMGNAFRLQAHNDLAMEQFRLGYETLIKAGLQNKAAISLQGLAGQYYIMNDFAKALQYLRQAMKLNTENKDLIPLADNYNLMGIVYRRRGPKDSAIYCYEQCIEQYTKIGDLSGVVYPLSNLGNVYTDLKQFDKAIELRRRAIQVFTQLGMQNQVGPVLNSLADTYYEMGIYDRALQVQDSAYHSSRVVGEERETRRLLLQMKSKIFEKQGKADSAFWYYKKYIAIRDSIYGVETTAKMDRTRVEFETKRKEDQIELLKRENDLKTQLAARQELEIENSELERGRNASELRLLNQTINLEKSRNEQQQQELEVEQLRAKAAQSLLNEGHQKQVLLQNEKRLKEAELERAQLGRNLLALGALLILALAFLVVNRIRFRQQKAKMETLTRLSRNLHDSVGSNLGSISMYSELARTLKDTKPEKLAEILTKIENNSRESVDMMADIVWSLKPENESLEKLILRLKNFALDVLQDKGIGVTFEIAPGIEALKTTVEQRTNLFMIGKEALFNASKYSMASKVTVHFARVKERLVMEISDSGIGFTAGVQAQSLKGNGLQNMKARANELGASLTLDSTPGSGTYIKLEMPV